MSLLLYRFVLSKFGFIDQMLDDVGSLPLFKVRREIIKIVELKKFIYAFFSFKYELNIRMCLIDFVQKIVGCIGVTP